MDLPAVASRTLARNSSSNPHSTVSIKVITLPVEFNASRRAIRAIEDGELLTEDEQRGARKTLTAAAMTYVAATAVALAQLLRLVLVFGRRRND